MAKLTINDVSSGYVSTTALNTAFTAIETALENTLSRDGTSPNQMSANLDMNGYAILNARATSGNENFIWMGTWTTGTVYAVNNLIYAPEGSNEGNTLICVTAHTAGATLDGDAAKWAVFAQRGAPGASGGDVVGPVSSTPDSLARFNGTTGKLLKNGAVIGTDVMAYDAGLAATTAFAKTLLDDADAAAARATLGVSALTPLDAYPVGAVYISVVSTSPATLFGGTWVAFGAGRVLVGIDAGQTEFDTVEETGGSKTHTLTSGEMPSHSHAESGYIGLVAYEATMSSGADVRIGARQTGATGGGGAHNNLQPYIVCYFWKRTA